MLHCHHGLYDVDNAANVTEVFKSRKISCVLVDPIVFRELSLDCVESQRTGLPGEHCDVLGTIMESSMFYSYKILKHI